MHLHFVQVNLFPLLHFQLIDLPQKTNSLIDLENSGPRVYGTTQNLQNLSHPS